MSDRLTVEDFRDWLEAQPRRTPVGTAGDVGGCPLARYLGSDFQVCSSAAFTTLQRDQANVRRWFRPLPAWARHFVSLVDGLPLPRGRLDRRIFPRTALALLDEAVACAADEAWHAQRP